MPVCVPAALLPRSHALFFATLPLQAKDVIATNVNRYEFDIISDETKVTKNGALSVAAYHVRAETAACFKAWTEFPVTSNVLR